MSLKELTWEKHKAAESTAFMKAVFSKTLPINIWVDYTYQKWLWYTAIENTAASMGLLEDIGDIRRAWLIFQDYQEMDGSIRLWNSSAVDYYSYILSIKEPNKIMAHLYTWHMGDMFGGQMIKKIIQAPSRHLEFNNVQDLIGKVRNKINDNMAEEANTAFDWAIRNLGEYDRHLAKNI